MTEQVHLPEVPAIKALIEGLTGADVQLTTLDTKLKADPSDQAAEYVLDNGEVAGVAFISLPLAIAAGAALGLVPQPPEDEVKAMKQIPEHLAPNVYELVNICAQLFNSDSTPHTKLSVLRPVAEVEGEAAAILKAPDRRVDLNVELAERVGTLTFAVKKLTS